MIYRPASKENNYTVIPNRLLRGGSTPPSQPREDGLSPESLGVLVYLLSHKSEWNITNIQLSKFFKITQEKVTKITRELEQSGYAQRSVNRNGGKVKSWDWIITDERNNFDKEEVKPVGGMPKSRKSQIKEKPDLAKEGTKNTIDKRNTINKEKPEPSIFKNFLENPPSSISSDAWVLWWNYKNINRIPAKSVVTRTVNLMKQINKTHNLKDCILLTIDHGWKGLPVDNDGNIYQICNQFKKNTLHLVK